MIGTGYSLDKNRHLFITVLQPSLLPILKCRDVHSTCIDRPHCRFKGFQTFLRGSLIHTEDRLVLSGKCISEPIFQETGGTDNDRALPEIFQQGLELLPDIRRKSAGHQCFFQRLRLSKISLFRALFDPGLPTVIGYNIRIKNIRPDIKGIMRFKILPVLRKLCMYDFPGK